MAAVRRQGDFVTIGEPSPQLNVALQFLGENLHPVLDQVKILPRGWSRSACILCSLTVRDFLRACGIAAEVRSVAAFIFIVEPGKPLARLMIGADDTVAKPGIWPGHMVVTAEGFLIDTTMHGIDHPRVRCPRMAAVPLAKTNQPVVNGHAVIADFSVKTRDLGLQITWLDRSENDWRQQPDACAKKHRRKVLAKLLNARMQTSRVVNASH